MAATINKPTGIIEKLLMVLSFSELLLSSGIFMFLAVGF